MASVKQVSIANASSGITLPGEKAAEKAGDNVIEGPVLQLQAPNAGAAPGAAGISDAEMLRLLLKQQAAVRRAVRPSLPASLGLRLARGFEILFIRELHSKMDMHPDPILRALGVDLIGHTNRLRRCYYFFSWTRDRRGNKLRTRRTADGRHGWTQVPGGKDTVAINNEASGIAKTRGRQPTFGVKRTFDFIAGKTTKKIRARIEVGSNSYTFKLEELITVKDENEDSEKPGVNNFLCMYRLSPVLVGEPKDVAVEVVEPSADLGSNGGDSLLTLPGLGQQGMDPRKDDLPISDSSSLLTPPSSGQQGIEVRTDHLQVAESLSMSPSPAQLDLAPRNDAQLLEPMDVSVETKSEASADGRFDGDNSFLTPPSSGQQGIEVRSDDLQVSESPCCSLEPMDMSVETKSEASANREFNGDNSFLTPPTVDQQGIDASTDNLQVSDSPPHLPSMSPSPAQVDLTSRHAYQLPHSTSLVVSPGEDDLTVGHDDPLLYSTFMFSSNNSPSLDDFYLNFSPQVITPEAQGLQVDARFDDTRLELERIPPRFANDPQYRQVAIPAVPAAVPTPQMANALAEIEEDYLLDSPQISGDEKSIPQGRQSMQEGMFTNEANADGVIVSPQSQTEHTSLATTDDAVSQQPAAGTINFWKR